MYDKSIVLKKDESNGYWYFMDREHPLASRVGKVYYHRHVLSLKLGRWLTSSEHVHHVDGNKDNCSEDNLVVVSRAGHAHKHRGVVKKRRCDQCGHWFKPAQDKGRYCSTACSAKSKRKFDISAERLRVLVKTTPLTVLAKRFGVSDKAIAKRCKRLGIETVPRGAWSTKRNRRKRYCETGQGTKEG